MGLDRPDNVAWRSITASEIAGSARMLAASTSAR
jgi:hypothetical protein